MSQTSIFEKSWLDLVFEGKNKAYGAYQLRLENPRTTMLALLYALLFIGGVTGGGLMLSSFGNKPKTDLLPPIENDTIVIAPYYPKPDEPVIPKPKTDRPPSTASEPVDDWRTAPVVAPRDVTTADPVENPTPSNGGSETGNSDLGTAGNNVDAGGAGNIDESGDEIATPPMLDRQPMFPGGMPAFYQYVGNNFDKPDLNEAKPIRIFVSFVIEKDGSMTDIEVKNKPGYALEKEAIRVLKSLKKKWEPGMRRGEPVRVLYTLPIVVKPE